MDSEASQGRAGEHSNRLLLEKSPYLLQHASNPVDWHPWGPEAFEKARRDDKPVFLSIGYSTCHWCHVMARESFEDKEVAALMNEVFVPIKVDREERPDLDNVYMAVCQMMAGAGGWPLTIIMTPDGRPFFAATYLPKSGRFGRMGLLDLAHLVREIWTTRRDDALSLAGEVDAALQQQAQTSTGAELLDQSTLRDAYQELARRFDGQHGGFGTAPKFPTPHNLLFLLRYWKRSADDRAMAMVEQTLRAMRHGGVYDQIGFGFHRYSTDAQWLVPHFEKMLYDQAMLATAYTETYQATGREEWRSTAREILAYVLRDMTAPEGGFYSAEDADSEEEEGKYYLWTEEEVRGELDPDEADLVVRAFGIQQAGNFVEEATGRRTGRNILHLRGSIAEVASALEMPEPLLKDKVEAARRKLIAARERRIHPQKDDKILTDWNGLMIAALAKAAQVFDDPGYEDSARRAADFIWQNMRTADGRLLHRYRDGQAAVKANLDDYAFLAWGLIELYEATFDVSYLENALELARDLRDHFWDDENGAFFFTPDDGESLLVRQKEVQDRAIPSGNSVAMLDLLRLGRMTADPDLEVMASGVARALSGVVKQSPGACTYLAVALDFGLGPSYEAVVAGLPQAEDTNAMLRALRSQFLPNKVVLLRPTNEACPGIVRLAEFTQQHASINGKATAYVCLDNECRLPTTDAEEMLELLEAK
jgi:uncharacterized protein YyaL (SSP411 family)